MYYKKLQNGKVRFFDTYKSLNGARKQVTVTLETASAQSQRTATKLLAQKINRKIQSELKATEAFNNATLSQVFEVYWNIREQEISPSYAYREKKQFENFLIDFEFGNKKIKSTSSIELQKFVNFFDKPTTRQEFKRILVQLFEFAFNMRYIDVNEAKRIRTPKIKQTIEQKEKRDLKFFTVGEFNEFVDAARCYIKNLRSAYHRDLGFRRLLMLQFIFLTGCRYGEAAALEWENVDILMRDIYIRQSWQSNLGKIGATKNLQSVRHIAIDERTAEILEKMKAISNCNFVFATTHSQPFSNGALNKFMKKVGDYGGMKKNPKNFSTHMLRHSHITLLVLAGVSQKVIMDRVGHANPRTTSEIYTHLISSQKQQAVKILNDLPLLV
ncbi:tyrosine-type recombinase/integrase [Lactococcus paracarnosus]|uniref:Site-specific integrase n=1 Tax=Pseudolactococcus paracarnosus TaxID=2749962 RepID=A0ABT0AL58_9LACT|nr:site-specific integrase [Lactococcus paracarnosus]MCJ1977294.1 site-specific integrase [Lactococcus paracarnosus]MCJ1983210.1 site-specific integrase [Lactococcus paracarnosus]MCJ1998839.1 site-specific integrase [Lactococcus paracarnosus]